MLDPALSDVPVTLSIESESLQTIAELFARQLHAEVVTVGDTWYIGDAVASDNALLIVRFPRLAEDELRGIVESALSDTGVVETLSGGVVIVLDSPRHLRRVAELRSALDDVEQVTWGVQLYLVRDTWQHQRDIGLDVVPALDVAYTAAAASGGVLATVPDGLSRDVVASLTAALRAEDSRADGVARQAPMLVCADGGEATYQDGLDLLLPTGVTDLESGATLNSGFERVQTGLLVTVRVRETDYRTARLQLDLETSAPEGTSSTGGVQIGRRSLKCEADVRDGGVYLLGEVSAMETNTQRTTFLQWGEAKRGTASRYQVWCRVHRIGGTKKNERFENVYGKGQHDSSSDVASSGGSGVGRGVHGVSAVRPVVPSGQDDVVTRGAGTFREGSEFAGGSEGGRVSEVGTDGGSGVKNGQLPSDSDAAWWLSTVPVESSAAGAAGSIDSARRGGGSRPGSGTQGKEWWN